MEKLKTKHKILAEACLGPVRKWVEFFDEIKTLCIIVRNYFSEKSNCVAL